MRTYFILKRSEGEQTFVRNAIDIDNKAEMGFAEAGLALEHRILGERDVVERRYGLKRGSRGWL